MRPEQIGRYKLIDELARNASGVVYKARDPLIDRIVTIKTIDVDLPRDEVDAFQKRLDREVRAAGRLNHPNIVTIHDVGRSGDVTYIAMEYMDGRSLREIFDSGAVLPPARIADMAAQIADGLDFVHRHGIVHRDIKPENIIVLRSGVVKITNFGIARISVGSRTMIDTSLRSRVYISPEQVMGRAVDDRSDVFSLGVVLYEMLTGRPPFAVGELSQIVHQVLQEAPLAPSSYNRSVAPAFDAIVAKAMAKNPNDRYRSAREMALDLRNLAPGAPAIAAEVPAIAERLTSNAQPADDGVLLDSPFVDVATTDVSAFDDAPTTSPRLGPRRKLMFYGLGGAALLAGGSWTLLSGRMVAPPTIDERIASSSADDSKSSAVKNESVDGAPLTAPPATRAELSAGPNVVAVSPQVANKRIAPPAQHAAWLALAVSPWGEVFVDGDRKGISPPLTEVRLLPGKHTIEIRNTNFMPYTQAVELRANGRLRIKYKFN